MSESEFTPYAELRCRTNHSFLHGASTPAELMEQARELGLHSLAITDIDGVYGMPKAYRATRHWPAENTPRLIVGAELTLEHLPRLTLLARDRPAYGLLCRMLSASHAGREKGHAALRWKEFLQLASEPRARGLVCLPRLEPPDSPLEPPAGFHETLADLFKASQSLYVPVSRFLDGSDTDRLARAHALSARLGVPLVATNDAHYHLPERRVLQDLVTSIRHTTPLSKAGSRLFSNGERYLKSPRQMAKLFRDLPDALHRTLEIAESCRFSPKELRYRYPSEWIPSGETAQSYLHKAVREGALTRYPGGVPADVESQLRHELALVEQLGFADYFLTIWEIVQFARERGILCQGRGSAANSVICYCLGVTAIDPVRMNLLFERFISVERGEPPDIDVDFEHERREEVIQHIYAKYGRDRAGMVAALICYRDKLAVREACKALELPIEAVTHAGIGSRGNAFDADYAPGSAQRYQFDTRHELAARLADGLYGFPRHLSIHSGGFTLSADPIIETVPIEPARMEGRTIVQWDKDDLDAIGLLKIDVLSLGMLSALRKTLDLVNSSPRRREPEPLSLYTIPRDDGPTYGMIQRADTVGVFQIESRAQMSMLPRLLPKKFYDLVVQVAIVRPGPIQGGMVHPYLRRRRGEEPIDYPHPDLKPILERTHGVPLFQEQVMKIAIQLAGFTPGEADELRRAIGAWRSTGSIEKMGQRLMDGLLASGLPREFVLRIFEQIKGFAEYGFPESHAASFAVLAYASSYLKCHYPAEFACALVNSQPMGFYSVHTILEDAERHGAIIRPVDPRVSRWNCEMEPDGAVRLGWRVTRGLPEDAARALEAARDARPFSGLRDFLSRTRLPSAVLHKLAMGDAFACFGFRPRDALWEILAHEAASAPGPGGQLSLFGTLETSAPEHARFRGLDDYETIQADYKAYGYSTRGHPMLAIRARTPGLPRWTAARIKESCKHGDAAAIGGLFIVRQRPPTAKGTTFATLEDETGLLDLILHLDTYEKHQDLYWESAFLVVSGKIQRDGGAVSLLVKKLREFPKATQAHARQSGYHPRDLRVVM